MDWLLLTTVGRKSTTPTRAAVEVRAEVRATSATDQERSERSGSETPVRLGTGVVQTRP